MNGKLRSVIKGIAVTSVLLFGIAFILASCGKTTNHEAKGVPGNGAPGIFLEAIGPEGDKVDSASGKTLKVRANGGDSVEFIATVYGLSSSVGFYISPAYGIFSGGTPSGDGFTYFTADRSGKVRANMATVVGGPAGKQEVVAISLDQQARVQLLFEAVAEGFAIVPASITLDAVTGRRERVQAIGGVPPIQWSTSHPDHIKIAATGENGAYVWLHNPDFESGIITATDSVGNVATATVGVSSSNCHTGTLTIDPGTRSITVPDEFTPPGAGLPIGITVFDPDEAGSAFVTVTSMSPVLALADNVVPALGGDGTFHLNTTYTATGFGTFSFLYQDQRNAGNDCTPANVTATHTIEKKVVAPGP